MQSIQIQQLRVISSVRITYTECKGDAQFTWPYKSHIKVLYVSTCNFNPFCKAGQILVPFNPICYGVRLLAFWQWFLFL